MKNRSAIFICLLLFTTFAAMVMVKKKIAQQHKVRYTIGILQTATHPALDATRDGFIHELQQQLKSDVAFVVKNGEGTINHIYTIAQQFSADETIDAIFAIATPAAQAAASAEKEKPIIIAAVTDPKSLDIIHPTTNVTGVSDKLDVVKQLEAVRLFIPHARRYGILLNPAERNAIAHADRMAKELRKQNIQIIKIGVNAEAELPAALSSALPSIDVLIAPTDNMVALAMPLIVTLTQQYHVPFIVSDNLLVSYGALMSRGVDFELGGRMAARMAVELLVHKKKAHQMPIKTQPVEKIYVNTKEMNRLGLSVPEQLKNQVVMIDQR